MKSERLNTHHLIIGAGPVGLAVAKSFKAAGIPYHQVDADDDVGGNWYHGTYKSAHILSARSVMEYPDFKMPGDYPDFPSSGQMLAYYQSYASHYRLTESIQFNTKVIRINPITENLWEVTFSDKTAKTFKGVIVCNGHHWSKNFPKYDGDFTGETFHSKDYKSSDQLINKRVLVIGAGNSAFDIASESARVSSKNFLSVRRGIWIFPKTFMGKPLASLKVPPIPDWLRESLIKMMLKLTIGSHKEYGLPKPESKVFDRHPTVNTETLMHVKHGRTIIKGAVKRFLGNQVEFEDGSRENVDTIVYATGFKTAFPFLPKELCRVEKAHVKVYGFSMYDTYKGLYLVGWMQPRGGVGSLITPYANLLANFIKLQDKVNCPVGMILKKMGEPLPTSHLFGGAQVIKWIEKTEKRMDTIEKEGLKIDKHLDDFMNKPLEPNSEPLQIGMQVY
ncbi:NAD(P)-binding domain-containing protein [Aequorivita todarodis]|uniref:flavin-containing monooxygenase n=1 Tax=Aequorivita todarodis TaxID=2036821 RepID=UPI002350DB68|nr:NAD(P)-binding domain-containing protein [Aequorivita todarodis]MDC7999882.1 NAD(P)-binding domain-containing protein [Aequorivita todarodis]